MMNLDLNSDVQESEGMNHNSTASKCGELKKSCRDCQTTRTPCWRSGPAGPKTLCNACGIRYRKKSRSIVGLEKGAADRSRKKNGKKVPSKTPRDILFQGQWKRKLGEVEQAAFLLMALSYGCVSA